MKEAPALPSYKELSLALQENRSSFGPSQVHGLLCGLICSTPGNKIPSSWIQKTLGSSKNKTAVELLHSIYETSYHQLTDFSFEFTLLLPDDTASIETRTEELGLWCQGFLTGLGDAATKTNATEEVSEAIADITEIAQVNFDNISESEEDETAYFELLEYVRLAALMLFHELQPTQSDRNRSLH